MLKQYIFKPSKMNLFLTNYLLQYDLKFIVKFLTSYFNNKLYFYKLFKLCNSIPIIRYMISHNHIVLLLRTYNFVSIK